MLRIKNKFVLCISVCLLGMVSAVRADGNSRCQQAMGTWSGTGEFVLMGGSIRCQYNGKGHFSGAEYFSGEILFTRSSGLEVFCPQTETVVLEGRCSEAGEFTVFNQFMNLTGRLSEGNQTALLDGKLKIAAVGTGSVHVSLNKESSSFWQLLKLSFR